MTKRKCPINGCSKMLPGHILMCRAHWGKVPKLVQQRVYETWNSGKSSADYVEARKAAIDLVEQQLNNKN